MGYSNLANYVSDDERRALKKKAVLKIDAMDIKDIMMGEKGSFAEIVNGDLDDAIIVMKAVARMREQGYMTSVFAYLFANHNESEEKLQQAVQSYTVKSIRERTGLNQQQFSDFCEIKVRTIESWEQGERKLNRCNLRYLIERSSAAEDDLFTMTQYHTTDSQISKESVDFLKSLSECGFKDMYNGRAANEYPYVRQINKGMFHSPELLIRVDKEEYIEDGKVKHKYDLLPEDVKEIMEYALGNNCDEVYIELTSEESSSYLQYMNEIQKK